MNGRIAVLDFGTNTFHLLIAEVNGHEVTHLLKHNLPVKLGEGGIAGNYLTPQAIQRGLAAIGNLLNLISGYQVTHVKAVATAAIRNASNGNAFIAEVKRLFNLDIEMINGFREAELIYKGVRSGLQLTNTPNLIVDIGGGSVEFILCNATNLIWKNSYPVGVAWLMERFQHSDPVSDEDINAIEQHLDEILTNFTEAMEQHQPCTLIGSEGAFETFAQLCISRFNLPETRLTPTGFNFDRSQLEQIIGYLLASDHPARMNDPDIIPLRVDMIVTAAILTRYLMRKFRFDHFKLSAFSLKEGVLASLLE